jgi:hypothetical protein
MHRFFDPAGSGDDSRKRRRRCCLPPCRTASAPQTRRLRGSITRPARTPTDASPPPSRTTTHGSGPSRLATPSMLDSLIPFSGPVYPGAPYTDPRTLPARRASATDRSTAARGANRRSGSCKQQSGHDRVDTGTAQSSSAFDLPATHHQDLGPEVGSCSVGSYRKRRTHPAASSRLFLLVSCERGEAGSGCSEREGLRQSDRVPAGCPYWAVGALLPTSDIGVVGHNSEC